MTTNEEKLVKQLKELMSLARELTDAVEGGTVDLLQEDLSGNCSVLQDMASDVWHTSWEVEDDLQKVYKKREK